MYLKNQNSYSMFYLVTLINAGGAIRNRAGSYIAINNPATSNHIHNYMLGGENTRNPDLNMSIANSMEDFYTNLVVSPKNIYLANLENFLSKNYQYVKVPAFRDVFSHFYDHFAGKKDESVMCLAFMIYLTEGFKNLSNSNDGFVCRGFLRIKGKGAYEIASEPPQNFVQNPADLGEFSLNSMKGTLRVYQHFLRKNAADSITSGTLTLKEMVDALSPNKTKIADALDIVIGDDEKSDTGAIVSALYQNTDVDPRPSTETEKTSLSNLYERLCDTLNAKPNNDEW